MSLSLHLAAALATLCAAQPPTPPGPPGAPHISVSSGPLRGGAITSLQSVALKVEERPGSRPKALLNRKVTLTLLTETKVSHPHRPRQPEPLPEGITEADALDDDLQPTCIIEAPPRVNLIKPASGNTDSGNAERLVQFADGRLLYCFEHKNWLIWDGRRFKKDDTQQSVLWAKSCMLALWQQALTISNEDYRRSLCGFARESLNAKNINSMLSLAKSMLAVPASALDSNPHILNVLNGTLELKTGELKPHSKEDLLTKLVHHAYNRYAECPKFEKFLYVVTGCDAAMVDYLQVAIGYSLTGCTIEKAVFVLLGVGNNGKSTFLNAISRIIPEYSSMLDVGSLMTRQESNNAQSDLADLKGARFVQTSESEDGQRLFQAKLKRLAQGMGKIRTVRKYENWIEFDETHKIFLDTNRKPVITDADDLATFNRLHPICFPLQIPDEHVDRELSDKLFAEAEGILAWAVEGAKLWYAEGLQKPPAVIAANREWQAESDKLGQFIDASCDTGPDCKVKSSTLYACYRAWMESNGLEHSILSSVKFADKLKIRDGISKKPHSDGTYYHGLKPKPQNNSGKLRGSTV